jgi:glucose-1-phosphate thymidylyltransferase
MVNKGAQFAPGTVSDWMDCGNKDAMIDTNKKVLGYISKDLKIPSNASINNSVIIDPCFIGEGAVITNAVVGPFTSVGAGAHITNAVVASSIVLPQSKIQSANLSDSMIGVASEVRGSAQVLSLSDYSVVK